MSAHVCISEFDPECPDCIRHDETCGTRCDRCSERMCEQFGPEPRACLTTCVDCECDCQTCVHVAQDIRADLNYRTSKEAS